MARVPTAAWAILAVALVLRIGAGALLSDRLEPSADELSYRAIAESIADGDGYLERQVEVGGGPSAASPPAFPYLVGAVFAASDDSLVVARAVQALLGTLTVALIGIVAWLVFERRVVALAAMALAACYPPLVVISAPLMTESLLLPLILGAVAAALLQRRRGGLAWAALAGLLAGLAALTKDVGVIALLAVAVAVWPSPRLRPASLRVPAVALAVAALALTPWTIRNAVEFGELVPITTRLGFGVGGTYNEAVRADPEHVWRPVFLQPEFSELLFDSGLDEADVSAELSERSLEFAADHPGYPLEVAYWNARRLLQLRTSALIDSDAELLGFGGGSANEAAFEIAYWSCAAGFVVLAVLALIAVIRGYAGPVPRFIWVLMALMVLPSLLLAAGPRYRLPAEVLLIVAAAPALARTTKVE
jgi:4-amino-4-deoxy-L-arabinose transferase-like glycosyltransferase